jgi:hypothetical protein
VRHRAGAYGVKILAFILLAIGTVALSYGNAPAKRIKDCENAGVCMK